MSVIKTFQKATKVLNELSTAAVGARSEVQKLLDVLEGPRPVVTLVGIDNSNSLGIQKVGSTSVTTQVSNRLEKDVTEESLVSGVDVTEEILVSGVYVTQVPDAVYEQPAPYKTEIVELGEHTLGKPFKEYTINNEGALVMGKDYEDTKFDRTINSVTEANPVGLLAFETEGDTFRIYPAGY